MSVASWSKFKVIRIGLIAILISNWAFSQSVDERYSIGTWYGFSNAAISFTFDDGSPKQYSVAVPLFNEFDMNLTLFIVTGESFSWPAQWDKLQQAAADGHEIASHTITHTSFGDISDSLEIAELQDSKEKIEAYITDQKCITMAYPYCVTGNKSICAEFYSAARICSGQIENSTPRDFMAISSIICGTEGSVKTADNFISKANSALRKNGWCVHLLHGVDNDGGWSPVTSDVLRETLTFLSENKSDYWIDSFGNVTRYILERNAASVTELSADDSTITVQVADSLDNAAFNHPITIRRTLPQNWGAASTNQNGTAVPTSVVQVENEFYIQFDAVPDAGDVILMRQSASRVEDQPVSSYRLEQNYPNPFNPKTTIAYDIPSSQPVTLELFNVKGKHVSTLVNEVQNPGHYSLVLDAEHLASGVYFYCMRAGSFTHTRRLLVLR